MAFIKSLFRDKTWRSRLIERVISGMIVALFTIVIMTLMAPAGI